MVVFLTLTGAGRLPLLLALGFVGLMATPVIMASVQESFPENRALANGLYMALNLGVRSFIVVLVGILCDRFGMRQAFLACAAVGLLGTPLIFLLPSAMGSPGKTQRQHDDAD